MSLARQSPPVRRQAVRPPPPPPPPPPHTLRLHQLAITLCAVGQLMVVVRQNDIPGFLLTSAAWVLCAVGCALALVLPGVYWQNMSWLLPSLRVALFSLPSVRRVGVGIALLLERPAQAGLRGAGADFLSVLLGTRVFGVALVALLLVVPPAATLLTQTALVMLSSNSLDYCRTPLLTHPLTAGRLRVLATALESGALPLGLVLPPAVHMSRIGAPVLQGTAEDLPTCQACLCFITVALGVLLPTLVSVLTWERRRTRQPPRPPSAVWLGRILQQGRPVAATADKWLRRAALGPRDGRTLRIALRGWYLLVLTWWWSRIVAGL